MRMGFGILFKSLLSLDCLLNFFRRNFCLFELNRAKPRRPPFHEKNTTSDSSRVVNQLEASQFCEVCQAFRFFFRPSLLLPCFVQISEIRVEPRRFGLLVSSSRGLVSRFQDFRIAEHLLISGKILYD